MRIAGVEIESIVDGLGIRYTIFTQGCKHNCKGCHNPSTHDMNGGLDVSIIEIAQDILSVKSIDGVTLSGGDPIYQVKECNSLIEMLRSQRADLNFWVYTGFTLEQLIDKKDNEIDKLLNQIDVLVDGKFILEKKTLNKPFVGSSNQRVIDMQAYRENGIIKELEIEEVY